MERWPNFFIVGADKAGTSSLYAYLITIPGIFMSKIKEPNYFSIKTFQNNHHLRPIRDKKKYLGLFKDVKDEKIIGEASPSYLADPEAPNLIHQVSPEAKILISLRDPVERIFSHYLMMKRLGKIKSTFHNNLQISLNAKNKYDDPLWLDRGLYLEHVNRYISIFGKEQVKIIIFEDFIKEPRVTIEDILNFLKLEYDLNFFNPEVYNKFGLVRGPIAEKILNSRLIRRVSEKFLSTSNRRILKEKFLIKEESKPEMDKNDRQLLINYYLEDVKKIRNFLGIDLPWKNFFSYWKK